MLEFNKGIDIILKHEDWNRTHSVEDLIPPKFGISIFYLRRVEYVDCNDFDEEINIDELKSMDLDKAKEFIKLNFYNRLNLSKIHDEFISLHLFDQAINSGTGTASRLMQFILGVKQTNNIDDKTVEAINNTELNLLQLYIAERQNFYITCSVRNSKNRKYLQGWMARIKDTKL